MVTKRAAEPEAGGDALAGTFTVATRVAVWVCVCVATVTAASVLVGWATDNRTLTAIVPGMIAMNPLTAICFMVCAAAMAVWRPGATGPRVWVACVLAAIAGGCGLIRLGGYVLGWDVAIDGLLFSSRLDAGPGLPNRMAPNTAFNFALLGLSLLHLALARPRRAQILVLATALTAFSALLGYAYSVTSLMRVATFIPMALHTAMLFVVLSAGVLLSSGPGGVVEAVARRSPGGRMMRRMIPAMILAPPCLGWLRLQGEFRGLFSQAFGVAAMVGAMIVVGLIMTWVTARALDRTEAERRRAEAATLRLAHFDNLTGLPNRLLFEDRLKRALARARRAKSTVALLFLDLDGFKQVNDSLGHEAGDQVLKEAARRIGSALRAVDTAARLGGDEFTVVLEQMKSRQEIEAVAARVLLKLREPCSIGGHEAQLSVSVGVSEFPRDGSDPAELLSAADAAMYRAKRGGKNQIAFHSAAASPAASGAGPDVGHRETRAAPSSRDAGGPATGSSTVNVAPCPSTLSTPMVPPIASTFVRLM